MKRIELGTVVAEFRPDEKKGNPRNSEGAFLTLADGNIIFAFSKFRGENNADWAPSDICMVISKDGGMTFGEERVVVDYQEEESVNVMSVSLMHMDNGDIGMFYLVRKTYTIIQMYLRRSKDGGVTWGERVLCTPQEGFFVVNNDRVVRLLSGRILIPAASHRSGRDWNAEKAECPGHGNGERENTFFDSRSEVVFFYSDDDGVTWHMSEGKCSMPNMANCLSGLQEPGVLELNPWVLWGFARTDLGRQYEMYSIDNGNKWTMAEPSRFTAPNSPLSMKRDTDSDDIYAVWNPVPEYNGREKVTDIFTGGRTPYVIAVSRDNGRTFTEGIAFEWEEDRGYCYCAMHFTKDALLLGYNAGGTEDKSCLARTRIRRIPREELANL
ncbi:MAG: exo-alpha-sialidase [Lachnospiraceae bacterium]|nr:exo-alpha-sialidase [Lachnospiraceae bacterium]